MFTFIELQERLALSRGFAVTIQDRRRSFHFDHNGLGRLLGKDPLEIDLDVARRGGMEAQQLRAAALEATRALVVTTMENAIELSIPLVAKTGTGANWMEAK